MNKLRLTFLRRLAFTGAAACLLTAGPNRARAVYTLTLQQTAGNVTITGNGSLNTTALTLQGSTPGPAPYNLVTSTATAFLIGTSGTTVYGGISGPTSFGTGGAAKAASVIGGSVGVLSSSGFLYVPINYLSGAAFTNTTLFTNSTFASLGFTPGTYTYTWGTGATADSLVVTSVVPEPGTWALLGVGVAGLGIVTLRRRVRAA